MNVTSNDVPPPSPTTASPPSKHRSLHSLHKSSQQGETRSSNPVALAWEPCGRVVDQERADFFEFMACNVVFAVVALVVLHLRSRRLQALRARQLAARIGLFWGTAVR